MDVSGQIAKDEGVVKRRRARGEGTVFQRKDGRWVARVHIANGRTQERFCRNEREALEALARLRVEALNGTLVMTAGLTVKAFLMQWLTMKEREVKAATHRSYEGAVRLYLLPTLGRLRLRDLTPLQVSRMVGEIQTRVSANSAAYALRVLRMALKQAVLWEMLPRNAAEAVRPPRVDRQEMRVWAPAEVARFLDHARSHRLYALFYLALTTGMRRGELLGLHWNSVDLAASRLRVRHNLIHAKGGARIESPKTRGSNRSIQLSADVVDVLSHHQQRQQAEINAKLQRAREWPNPELVFTSEEGTPLDPSNVVKLFRTLSLAADVPIIRIHDLRHTSASLMIRQGIPAKLVADRLGHSDPGFTLKTYTHVFEEHREEAALSLT